MSDLTPPKYWETQGQADHWLDRFVKEVEGPVGTQSSSACPPLSSRRSGTAGKSGSS